MALYFYNCDGFAQRQIVSWEPVIRNVLQNAYVPFDLRSCIAQDLDYGRVVVECGMAGTGKCSRVRGATYPDRVLICTTDGPALLLHELVHRCGGNEFDAEVFENYLFPLRNGAAKPGDEDLDEFRAFGFRGRFAYRYEDLVYTNEGRVLGYYSQILGTTGLVY